MLIRCRMEDPIRPIDKMPFDELWNGGDRGILLSYERGRQLATERPELAEAAKRNELPILPWQGGVDSHLKSEKKVGCHYYYAMWHGLRGEDVEIDTHETYYLICRLHYVKVTYPPLL